MTPANNDSAPDTPGVVREINARNLASQQNWRKAWLTIYTLIGCLAVSLLLNFYQVATRETPLPIGLTPDWRVVALTPISEANLSDEGVRNWAARTIPTLYDLDFRKNKAQIAGLEPIFTEAGYQGYLEALKRTNLLETIKKNNYVVSAAPTATPQVVGRTTVDGAVTWKVRAPILVTFDNGSTPVNQQLMVTTFIKRVPESRNPFGIQIHSFAAARE